MFAATASRARARSVHVMLQLLGFGAVVCGFAAIVANKVRIQHAHFRTFHNWLGLAALLGMGVQFCVGIPKLRRALMGEKKYKWHGMLGVATFTLATLASIVGIHELFNKPGISAAQRRENNVLVLFVGLSALSILYFYFPNTVPPTPLQRGRPSYSQQRDALAQT